MQMRNDERSKGPGPWPSVRGKESVTAKVHTIEIARYAQESLIRKQLEFVMHYEPACSWLQTTAVYRFVVLYETGAPEDNEQIAAGIRRLFA